MEDNQQQVLIETQFQSLTIQVRPDETHEWFMETKLVAEGYEVSIDAILAHKKRNAEEFEEGRHFLTADKLSVVGQKPNQIYWTKRGVIRLGFFIKSERARLFRDWAEDLIIRELDKKNQSDRIDQLEAKMHQYLDAIYQMTKNNKKDIQETKEVIHNITVRMDKLEKYISHPHKLEEQKSYTYLFRKVDTNEYKIGKSNKPLDRIKNFEVSGAKMELILAIEFPNSTMALLWEDTLKKTLKHLNLYGEWFLLSTREVKLLRGISEVFEQFY
jgi:hypothetical protein